MSIVTTLTYGGYTIALNPSPFLSEADRHLVAESEITIYSPSGEVLLIADAKGTQLQMQRYAESEIDCLLPRCPCSDEQPVKPGYKLCWDCKGIVAANGEDEEMFRA